MNRQYKQLDIEERRKIERWMNAKVPVREMARVLCRSKATLYRELKRNYFVDESLPKYAGYYGAAAQLKANDRRARECKLIKHPDLARRVIAHLKHGWTPEQIGNRMIYEQTPQRVCQETIYYIYSPEGMAQELWWYLPEHRKSRKPRRARKRQAPKFDRDVSILFRPDDIAHRRQFGHWEGDLMLFKQKLGQTNITSLVERISRFTVLLKNKDKRSRPVMGKIIKRCATCLCWPAGRSPSTVAQSSPSGRIYRPSSAPKPGSATPPRPGRKAPSRTRTGASAGGCHARATSQR